MKPLDDVHLKKNLSAAFHTQPAFEISPLWQQNTMRCIRDIGPLKPSIIPHPAKYTFAELVWKMAPAFCMLLIILITGMVSMDLSLDTVINDSFIEDPVVTLYSGIFWG